MLYMLSDNNLFHRFLKSHQRIYNVQHYEVIPFQPIQQKFDTTNVVSAPKLWCLKKIKSKKTKVCSNAQVLNLNFFYPSRLQNLAVTIVPLPHCYHELDMIRTNFCFCQYPPLEKECYKNV